jgi:hypothetical protein
MADGDKKIFVCVAIGLVGGALLGAHACFEDGAQGWAVVPFGLIVGGLCGGFVGSMIGLAIDIPWRAMNTQRRKYIHIKKAFHGKSESISSTSLLVRTGAPGPKVTAGNPETGSTTILPLVLRFV